MSGSYPYENNRWGRFLSKTHLTIKIFSFGSKDRQRSIYMECYFKQHQNEMKWE